MKGSLWPRIKFHKYSQIKFRCDIEPRSTTWVFFLFCVARASKNFAYTFDENFKKKFKFLKIQYHAIMHSYQRFVSLIFH